MNSRPVNPNPPCDRSIAPKTILVIEDDDACLETLRLVLRRKGHLVLSASDVSAAEEKWAMAHDTIDLVVSDNYLGYDLGSELVQRFQQQKPGVHIVLCSALPLEHELPGIRFLPKPFSIDALLES
jgi:DNA-binding NtrC family response regulator